MKPFYLICYDITDPRRLQRVYTYLAKHAHHVQWSVFLAPLTRRQHRKVVAAIARRIDPASDDVRFYRLPANAQTHWLGRSPSRDGVTLYPRVLSDENRYADHS